MAASPRTQTQLGLLIDRGLESTDVRSQNELAERCGVAPSYLTKLRSGKIRHPSDKVVKRIADTLGQDVDDYHLALLYDHGEAPGWLRVLSFELGERLSAGEERAIQQVVEAMLKLRRGT